MKKLKFTKREISVEKNERKFKVLETPTLLKELYLNNVISLSMYEEKVLNYQKAIRQKEELPVIDTTSELQLRDYQQRIVDYAKHFKSFAIFDEPRLGKTAAVLKLLEAKNLHKEKIIIAAPGKVIGNWIKEIKTWLNIKAIKYDGETIPKDVNIVVMTYARVRLSLNDLIKWKAKTFILDEAHVLRNSKGSRQTLTEKQSNIKELKGLMPINKSILKLAKEVEHRYPLSGTPSVNSSEDIFAILQFQMPNIFESYWNFVYYYYEVKISYWGDRQILGFKDDAKEQEFQELLNYISSNNKQKDSMKWLKQPIIYETNIELNERQKELENDLVTNSKIEDYFILTTLESYTHYQTLVINPKLLPMLEKEKDIGSKNKYILDELLRNKNSNVAIFTTRNKNVQMLEKMINGLMPERIVYKITGSTKHEEVINIQEKVNKLNKQYGIIVLGTIAASKEGISLQGLNKAYILDRSWVPTDMEQLYNRLNATTEENQNFFGEKQIEILHSPNTIDEVIKEALIYKKSQTEIINDFKLFLLKRKGENNGE